MRLRRGRRKFECVGQVRNFSGKIRILYKLKPIVSFRLRFVLATCFFARAICAQDADEPLSPEQAAATMKVPPGFHVTLFAGEPDIKQPIGFCIDDRSRLWVAEAYNYPVHGTGSGDRIVILEDSDGDGTHDKRTVFYDKLNYVTGIEVGFGGAWVMSPPNFYFIPDRNGDDVPDSEPQVLLDGFGNHANAHNLANGFAWGPDGWLYGTHGRTNWSMLGKPGTADDDRVRFDGGVYRYHPVRHQWEPYADGTTNPWGIDWNDYGHAFIFNCVNPHLFQVIQGAHYEPGRGRKSSQYAYQRIETIADHLHFTGLSNVRTYIGSHQEDEAGGGHAHCGSMVYLGDSLPDSYRNTLFTTNTHGRRINNDLPRRSGSGYIASHGADLMRATDPWFMGVTLAYGPAGEIYVSDWSDTGECHSTKNTRKQTGRIYRVSYGDRSRPSVDIKSKSNLELAELQLHKNDWFVRHARRLLHERAAAGDEMVAAQRRLIEIYEKNPDITRKLRAMWCLEVIDGLDQARLLSALDHEDENIRSWAVTLICESRDPNTACFDRMVQLAKSGSSPLVRLSLASALQRLPLDRRWPLAEALASRGEDNIDQNLPLMIWYGIEPLIGDHLPKYVQLCTAASISRVRVNMARRIASSESFNEGFQRLVDSLDSSQPDDTVREVLAGILQGIEGRRTLPLPAKWDETYQRLSHSKDEAIREMIVRLAVAYGDPVALESLRRLASETTADLTDRKRAIDALVLKRVPGFDKDLINLVADSSVCGSALRGLAAYDNSATPGVIIDSYSRLPAQHQQTALDLLSTRKNWANELLDAIESDRIQASDVSAYAARQIRTFGDPKTTARLASVWGEVRDTSKELSKQIATLKKWLTPEVIAGADLDSGKKLFTQHCAVCHKFFGEGGKVGPDITGSQRTNMDYMLDNIVDPSASVSKDYRMEVLQLDDGRVINGLIESENSETIAIQTLKERIVIPTAEVEARKTADVSIMPTGLLEYLTENQIRDLFGYLQRQP